ncbi:MAG: GDP-mannose 4,6-dehydratase [Deferribacteres bacterium]|nr:GDP-mannose 4,6-dehydratase [candidate division KSB1 bacterium]MCB9510300.1 GDP-mannose 4,6-dehydratase [Deferribacteres bacterium]
MKILITGGAGFVGSHLTDALLQRGHHVTIIDDLSTGRMENFAHVRALPNFHFVIETVMNETVMDRLVSECDMIYHLASAVGVELIVNKPVEVIERCILGSEMVLKIANRYKRKVLITSTSEIYGKSAKVPFSEEDDSVLGATTKSRWSYACSKAIDEFLALAYHKEFDLPAVLVRLFNTVGPRQTGQYGMVVPRFVQQAMRNEPLTVYGDGKQQRCFGYVGDVVGALVALMEQPKAVGQIFNIGNNQEVSIMELAERVIKIIGSKSKIKQIPYEEAYEAGFEDMTRRVPDLTKIKKLIGYKPTVGLDEIIHKIHRYFLTRESNGVVNGDESSMAEAFEAQV